MLPRDLARRKGGSRLVWVKKLRAAGWREQESNPKHRYVYILDKKDATLRERIEAMRRPYPKRATSVDSDAPAHHAGEGGAIPTVALLRKP
jgi:hypothetical protein